MKLILVRHGETKWNREYRVMGRMDLPLNEHGQMQAEGIGRALEHESIEAIYASPKLRAQQTAQDIDVRTDILSFHGWAGDCQRKTGGCTAGSRVGSLVNGMPFHTGGILEKWVSCSLPH